jgi:hypothetical protein
MPSSSGLLIIIIKPKCTEISCSEPNRYFTFYKNTTLTKVAYLLNVFVFLQNPELLSTASSTPPSQDHMSDMLIIARHFKV